jgi:hypothetical protein
MIGVRVECDADGCGRFFEIAGDVDLEPRPHRGNGQDYAVFERPYVTLPADWRAVSPSDGPGVRLLCADHTEGS